MDSSTHEEKQGTVPREGKCSFISAYTCKAPFLRVLKTSQASNDEQLL